VNTLLISFVVSLVTNLVIIRFDRLHAHFSGDHDLAGVQKFHSHSVVRIGGVGIMLSLFALGGWLLFRLPDVGLPFMLMLVASLPAFLGGLVEDLTKRVGVLARLGLTMFAALLGFWLLNAALTRLDIPMVDDLLRYGVIALIFTAVAVAGVANAINIIDGFNGLAGMVSVMILSALGYVAFVLGDTLLWMLSMATVGGILGFFVWNYPRGLIFLGDGGAYLIGFLIGEVSVLLVSRHPEVSPWFPLLLVIYPVFETLFSVYRRKFVKGASPGMPDALHLHTLVFRRLVRWATGDCPKKLARRNAATSPYLWLLCSISVIPAVLFWRYTGVLMVCVAGFVIVYVWLYRRIVRFRSPRLLVRKGPQ
jgi:UDP-N-acetylmuramyl pentapeptide phosphotransferase/UDP-N-acetylglucosamine-1-phosphate transferase